MNEILESDLQGFDEALRASAKAAGWEEEDTSQEGIIPDHIQEHPRGLDYDIEMDKLPEPLRWVGWATYRVMRKGDARRVEVFALTYPSYAQFSIDDLPAEAAVEERVLLGIWSGQVYDEWWDRQYAALGLSRVPPAP